jgi:hypothetical protein
MIRPHTIQRPHVQRHRGSAYVAVLGMSMIITVIGLSAVMATRIQTRTVNADRDMARAAFAGRSIIEIATHRIVNDASWRSTYTNDTWTADETLNELVFSYKLVDEEDGNLTDDTTQPVRLYARTTVDNAVRIYSVVLETPANANLLANADFEVGITGWTQTNCTLVPSGGPHGGAQCVLLQNRTTNTARADSTVTGLIENGKTYDVEVWAKTVSGTEQVSIAIVANASVSGVQQFITGSITVGTTWTKVTGTLTPTWTGTLSWAQWRAFSYPTGGTVDFYIDDAVCAEAGSLIRPVAGTWRQEVE